MDELGKALAVLVRLITKIIKAYIIFVVIMFVLIVGSSLLIGFLSL